MGPDDERRDRIAAESDQDLVLRVRNGDEEAFRVLFDRHLGALRERLGRWLPTRLQRKVSESDVLQEARLVAYQRLSDFIEKGSDGSFRNWLLRIVELKVREAVRKHAQAAKRAVGREVTRGQRPDSAQFPAPHPSPSEVAVASELREQIGRALGALPPDYREILRLVREEGLTLREAAQRMNRSREAAKKLYGRALFRLTEVFEKLQGEGHA
ncbi:MAG: sigma-70 family RNA polymerase sigma factor [Planctomycetota bacterium]